MKRRLLCILLALTMALAPFGAAFAEYDYSSVPTPKMIVVNGSDPSTVYYEREADTQAYPASTTKIMTCILALENFDLDEEVTVGEEILGKFELSAGYSAKSSLMGLEIGETVTMRDLLYGLMLVSGNEAADAIAVAVSGSVKEFVKLMNSKAAELGMTSTHFVNPNGVNNAEHYTTARDMSKLAAYALKNAEFRKIVGTASYTLPATNKHAEPRIKNNTNKLLYTQETDTEDVKYEYAIGVKTGDTPAAGKCLVAAAEKNGATVIIVMFGDENAAQYTRFKAAAGIFESVFNEMFVTVTADELNLQTEFAIDIANTRAEDLNEDGKYVLTANTSALSIRVTPEEAALYKSNAGSIVAEFIPVDGLSAPLSAGSTVGTVRYSYNGNVIYSATLKTSEDIRETVLTTGTQPGDADTGISQGGSLLSTATPEPDSGAKSAKKDGTNWLTVVIIILVVLIVILILFVVAVLIIREKKRREARRRRAKRRAAQRRALERDQYTPRSRQ